MVLYNVTVNVEENISAEWLLWMKNHHIPEMMDTGCFLSFKTLKLENELPDSPGITYCVQYWCQSKKELDTYLEKYAQVMRARHQKAFPNKFVAFRTILSEI